MTIEGTERNSVLVAVDWQRLFPWLLLFRTFRVAAAGGVLFTATVAVWATSAGWLALDHLIPFASAHGAAAGVTNQWAAADDRRDAAQAGDSQRDSEGQVLPGLLGSPRAKRAAKLLATLPNAIARPWGRVLLERLTWTQIAYNVLGSVWTIAVWGLAGGMITRIAVVRLGRSEHVGFLETARYVARRPAYFLAPLVPQIAFVLAIVFGVIAGWIMRIPVGALLVAVCWPVVVLVAVLCAVITLGLAVGWPFLWVVPSAERNGDAFEATQRSFSYAWERPLHYLFYVVVAALFGWAALFLVTWFVDAVNHFSLWTVAWGMSWSGLAELGSESSGVGAISARLIGMWSQLVSSVAEGFGAAYFWTAFAGIYLLLRRAVDEGMPVEEVYMPDEVERFQLPLGRDDSSSADAAHAGD